MKTKSDIQISFDESLSVGSNPISNCKFGSHYSTQKILILYNLVSLATLAAA